MSRYIFETYLCHGATGNSIYAEYLCNYLPIYLVQLTYQGILFVKLFWCQVSCASQERLNHVYSFTYLYLYSTLQFWKSFIQFAAAIGGYLSHIFVNLLFVRHLSQWERAKKEGGCLLRNPTNFDNLKKIFEEIKCNILLNSTGRDLDSKFKF